MDKRRAHLKQLKKAVIAALMTAVLLLCACVKDSGQITSFDQLNEKGKILAASTDAPEANSLPHDFPEATVESCTDIFPVYQEVGTGKVTAVFSQRVQMQLAIENGVTGVCLLEDTYRENDVAVGISRKSDIPGLKDKVNGFLKEMKEDGTLDDMYERWVTEGEYDMPDIPEAEDPQYTLVVATNGTAQPWTYYVGDELTGYDIELAKRFAYWVGADIRFRTYDWLGLLSAVQAGDADCIFSNLYYKPDFDDSMDFSDVYMSVEITAMVRDRSAGVTPGSFGKWLKNSFKKTFITEKRWKIFLKGMETTLIITLASVFFGTLLGFAAYMACRRGSRIANGITRFTVWLVQGMPVVVLLMLLYYVVFGAVSIPGVIVSIIGFTLIFGATVYERVKSGVAAVDAGQTKAAYSLGYSDRKAFHRIVLPQAMPHIMPSFKGDMTALLKATAVVGYIAVQDLTKMADIVRSRTYDAFFPLISIAVIYFILEALLNCAAGRIEPLFNPKRRRREDILRGVERK